ncbi:MAG: thioredoxin domain-containing protein [Acidobacteria bacterium]|nr:thioredoxin domain-containing protein [Acidobacteriota bacterium]
MLLCRKRKVCSSLINFFSLLLIQGAWLLWCQPLLAQGGGPSGSKTLAMVNGVAVTEEQVQNAARMDLERLEMQQSVLQAEFTRNKHQIVEVSLNRLVEEKLLDAEVAQRGITRTELLATEVQSKVQEPSDDDVDNFYEANKGQIGMPKEQVTTQIRQYLKETRRQELHNSFIGRLKTQYGVKSFLEPLRTSVETANHPARGSASAPLTIVEFSDFECPYCTRLVKTLKEVEKHYAEKVRLVFRQFPLANHPHAQKAAEASLCANEQDHFWEMHDLLFQEPKSLELGDIKAKAAAIGVDTTSFNECLDSSRYAERVRQDVRDGSRAGVNGTPAMFINGRFIAGAVPYDEIAKMIDEELPKATAVEPAKKP